MKKGLGLAFAIGVLGIGSGGVSAEPEPRISPFSGKPVPRFESLRYSTVNGRTGPSLEHPIAWRYERAGLPVMILKESMDWRRVRDPEGAEVWVHARMLSGQATAMVQRDLSLKRRADAGAEDVALLQAGVIVEVLGQREDMVQVRKGRVSGWVEASGIWGDPD